MLSGSERFKEGELERPYAATEMGLIYVNPQGPGGNPDPIGSAREIREAFSRMGMNDEETVALIAGGHAFGKCHGAGPEEFLGPDPDSSPVEEQGLGWKYMFKSGKGCDSFTSGFELTWSPTPTKFGIHFLRILFENEWELTKSPAGKYQWVAKGTEPIIPDACDRNKKHLPMMLTSDLALKFDTVYAEICKRFIENPEEFERAFAKAWFKLTHRDMGPKVLYRGPEVPKEEFIWQDSLPKRDYELIDEEDVKRLKEMIADSGLSVRDLVYTAWSAASTFRNSDRRGGANGGRIRLYPQVEWEVNHPENLARIIAVYEEIKRKFEDSSGDKGVSIADLIILGGNVGVEVAAKRAGFNVEVPFIPGRVDACQDQVEIEFYEAIEPFADGFRNYFKYIDSISEEDIYTTPEYFLIDKANLLTLTVPEMTVLLGGLRVMGVTYKYSNYGVLTENPESLTNDFFVNLLDMNVEWKPKDEHRYLFVGYDRKTKEPKWFATRVDLIFGHHEELRTLASVYASSDYKEQFVHDFVKVWTKVMNLDRFDVKFQR